MNIGFDWMLERWQLMYFTPFLWLICCLAALYLAVNKRRKELTGKFFIAYCISSLLIMDFTYIFIIRGFNITQPVTTQYLEISNTIYEAYELSVFYYFFYLTIPIKNTKKILLTAFICFILICAVFILYVFFYHDTAKRISKFSFYINCLEFFIIIPFTLLYFYHLIAKEPMQQISLVESPGFWITGGIFIYSTTSLPVLAITNNFFDTGNRYMFFLCGSIHYLSISILFICLAKAFSCRTNLLT